MPSDPPPGLGILQLLSAPESQTKALVARLVHDAEEKYAGSEDGRKVVGLVEELLIRRFQKLSREEIRTMFQLHDLRKTRFWQEAHEEGEEKGIEKGIEKGRLLEKKEMIRKMLATGLSAKQIAQMTEIPVQEVRRLAKDTSK